MVRPRIESVLVVVIGLMVTAIAGCNQVAPQSESTAAAAQAVTQSKQPAVNPATGASKGVAALREASESGKYLFAFFFKMEDEQTLAMRKVYDGAVEKMADRARSAAVNISDPAEKDVVGKFDLDRAPMPLVLAVAPNGAITGGFPTKFEEQQLLEAFASPATETCMKSLQDGKLVFLCVQNEKTKANEDAIKGVEDFKADERFSHATTIVKLDPADKKEASFLKDLQVAPETTTAVTVFLAPPGRALARYEGATSKDGLIETLSKANTGCGPGGCGPGGCGPKN
jgi:hypothetical protein